jgi:D-glycero-alpha-D-manno-heptose-7-phosphate kinase
MKFSDGADMYLCSDVESNSGLGASSSLTSNLVNVILKLQNKKWKKHEIAIKAYHIGHNILKWGIGKQDEFAAVFGGLNLFKYTKEGVMVKPIKLNQNTFQELQKKSMLFRIGNRKHSLNILQKQIKNMNNPKTNTLNALHDSKNLALDVNDALKNNDLEKFSELLNRGWKIKKQFASGVSNPRIEKIEKLALKHGAKSLKVTGAGGGGHMFVYAEPKKHKSIEDKLKKIGAEKVNFTYQDSGAKIFNITNL